MKSKVFLLCVLQLLLVATLPAAEALPTPLLTKPEAELLRTLNSAAGDKEKADACRELAVVGSKAAVPTLVRLLADERLGHGARQALETIPDASVDVALRGELSKLKGRPLVGVIASLGVRRDAKAVPSLVGLLADTDPAVAQAAARALGSIATADGIKALQTALPRASGLNQAAICEGLLRSAEALLAAGKTKPAIAVYEELRPAANLPPQVRAGALRGEIIARGPKDVALLKDSLRSPEYELFAVAIRSVLEMRQPGATQALAEILPRLTGDRELVAIKALGELGDDRAVVALLPLTGAGGKATRVAALQAAIATGQAAVVPMLVQLLGDADAEVSSVARDGLAAMATPAAPAAVTALLTSPSEARRVAAIELVGRRRMTSAVPALLQAASDPVAAVRTAAFKRLGELGSPAELQPLLQLLVKLSQPRELELAGEAVSAIGVRSGNPSASTAAVIRAFNSAAPAPKATLLSVLGAVGGSEALETVRLALSDPNAEVKQAAVRALAEWPDTTALPLLVQVVAAATDSSERDLAFQGLIRMTRESTATNEDKLKGLANAATMAKTAGEKRLVLAGLGDIPSMEALRAVAPYLSDTEVAEDASASAVGIANKLNASFKNEIIPILQRVLQVAKSRAVLEKARTRIEQWGQNAGQQPK